MDANMLSLKDIIRMVLGIALGFLIPYYIFINHNTIVKGPDSSEVQEKIFSSDDGFCYKMTPYPILSKGTHI